MKKSQEEKDSLRILYVITDSSQGGAQISLVRLMAELAKRGHIISLLTPRGYLADESQKLGIKVEVFKSWFSLPFKIYSHIKKENLRIINTLLPGGALAGMIGVLMTRRGYLFVTVNNRIFYGGISIFKRTVIHLLYPLLSLMKNVTFLSKSGAVKEELLQMTLVCSRNIVSIKNGIPVGEFVKYRDKTEFKKKLGIKPDEVSIGVMGRLSPQKGHTYLIEAAPQIILLYPKVKFYLIGDGPLKGQLQDKINKLGISDKFVLTGQREDAFSWLAAMDIVIHPSIFEGLPNSVIESLAAGKPVIATDAGGTRELIKNGHEGLIVEPKNSRAIAEAVKKVISNPSLAESMSKAGAKRIEAEYDLSKVAEETASIYKKRAFQFPRPNASGQNDVNSMQNVLIAISSSDIGGAQEHIHTLVSQLKTSHHFIIACPKGPLFQRLLESNADVYHVKFNLFSVIQIYRILKREHVGILHVHLLGSALIGTIAAVIARTPRTIYTVHNVVIYPGMAFWKKSFSPLTNKFLSKAVHKVIAVSKDIRSYFINVLKVKEEKISLVYNGVDPSRMIASEEDRSAVGSVSGDTSGKIIIGTIGRIAAQKSHSTIIEAMQILESNSDSIRCIIVGDGEKKRELETLVEKTGLAGKVLFPGFSKEISAWLEIFNIAVFPSIFEGFPITIVEAALAGKPIVASRVGGIPEIITDGVNGILIPPRDPKALAKSIEELIADPARAKKMGELARKRVLEEFDIRKSVLETIEIYR